MDLLAALLLHLTLTGLPIAAGALGWARRGVRSVPVLLALGLATGAGLAMATFWAFTLSPTVGKVFSVAALAGSLMTIGLALRGSGVPRDLLRALGVPFGLWALGSCFLLLLGFAHGGAATPIATATTRFTHQLPGDSQIPFFYATVFYEGFDGPPPQFPGQWLSSDRPHLQTGYLLGHRLWEWGDPELQYQVGGVVLQQLWIIGLWALLSACVGPTTRALVMVAALLSDLTITNGFFVWPKLLPVALLLALTAVLATGHQRWIRRDWRGAVLVAALATLAMMGHGSSVFGLLALLVLVVVRTVLAGPWPSWRWLGAAAAVAALVLAPWSLYQQHVDPPGNRVLKWHLAGQVDVDERGTVETVIDAYHRVGLDGALENKWWNLRTMAGVASDRYQPGPGVGPVEAVVKERRASAWYGLLPSLGLLLLGPVALLVGWREASRRPADRDFAVLSLGLAAVGALAWGMVQWGPPAAMSVLHAGSLLLPLLALCGCVAALRAVLPRVAIAWVALYALVQLLLYVPSFDPPRGTTYSVPLLLGSAACLAAYTGVVTRSVVAGRRGRRRCDLRHG
ncbi:hypothetical protein [Nocardioides pantholopis]|uniref:hypothetical protein n=1 Tax=Nocardioides pantholopis TaxID=2483798 RepID=UPI000F08A5C1|nr:hypothetical protein [Nocardioides pantholopis]